MSLKTITTIPQPPRYSVPQGGFYATHDGRQVVARGELTAALNSGKQIIAADTQAEVDAEIARLNLTPLPKTQAELATDVFRSLPAEVQAAFGPAFDIVNSLSSNAEKVRAIQAVNVPPELAAAKAQILAAFGVQ